MAAFLGKERIKLEKYLDKTLSFEERAKDLVSRMTLDEKASQLTYHSAAVAVSYTHLDVYKRQPECCAPRLR